MKKILFYTLALMAGLSLTGCNEWLDKNPDDRAELNDDDKVTKLLVSAYPTHSPALILEMSSDNMGDNGENYSPSQNHDALYRFVPVETEGNDDPRSVWNALYETVASANYALEAINELGGYKNGMEGQYAEALLCRAYAMFELANTFCMAYDSLKADGYKGLPYPKAVSTDITAVEPRGTLKELYKNIDDDIEEALPLMNDNHLTTPKYHFNTRAGYAFAARFNLYYGRWSKAVTYANKVLGTGDPTSLLREWAYYANDLAGAVDISNHYMLTSETANIMMLNSYSLLGRTQYSSYRYNHNYDMVAYETFWAKSPFGNGSSANTLYWANMMYGSNQGVYLPKIIEQFEYTDKVNLTGYAHVVHAAFTTDETLLVRAEANAQQKNYDAALKDMNYWTLTHCSAKKGMNARPTFTIDYINEFFNGTEDGTKAGMDYSPVTPETNRERTIRKIMNPQGFTIEEGTQENMLQIILYMRRIEGIWEGWRFQDCKRYGIEYTHFVEGGTNAVFKAGDLRGAIQLPNDVISAGMEANPR